MSTNTTTESDTVQLRIRTYIDDEIQYAMRRSEWETLKNDSPPMYCCMNCGLVSRKTRRYKGAMNKCPTCRNRMDSIKYITKY